MSSNGRKVTGPRFVPPRPDLALLARLLAVADRTRVQPWTPWQVPMPEGRALQAAPRPGTAQAAAQRPIPASPRPANDPLSVGIRELLTGTRGGLAGDMVFGVPRALAAGGEAQAQGDDFTAALLMMAAAMDAADGPAPTVAAAMKRAMGKKGAKKAAAKVVKPAVAPADYGMTHRPNDADGGAPLHDLTGGGVIYPDDVYSPDGARLYGAGGDDKDRWMDRQSHAIAMQFRGKPDAQVTIYRAIPDDITTSDKIAKLEKQKAYILKHGKLPPGVESNKPRYQYYDEIHAELERLRSLPPDETVVDINPGDWVTINRGYAKQHGESNLPGGYRIISKKVRAGDIFTSGDSFHEWGYSPQSAKPKGKR